MATQMHVRAFGPSQIIHSRLPGVIGTKPNRHAFSRTLRIESLETRTLLTTLLWSAGVGLSAPVTEAAVANYAGVSYVFGGANGSQMPTTVYQYTPGDSAWTAAAQIDRGRAGGGVGFTGRVGALATSDSTTSDIFNFGGAEQGQATNTVFSYNGDFNPPSMSTARAFFAYVTDPLYPSSTDYQTEHDLYAIGGLDASGHALASAERYDIVSDTWTAIAPLPQALSHTTAADDGAGHIFVFGGDNSAGQPVATVHRYTISTDSWDTAAAIPTALSDATAVYAAYGEIFLVGGRNSAGQAVSNVQWYNPVLDAWTAQTSLPSAVYDAGAVIDSAGNINVVGGTNSSGTAVANVWISPIGTAPQGLPAYPQVSVVDGYYVYDGLAHSASATAFASDGVTPVSGTFTFTYSGSPTSPTAAGTYQVVGLFTSADPASYVNAYADGQLVIDPATPAIQVTGAGTFSYDAQSHAIAVAVAGVDGTTPVSGTVTTTYNGSATPPTAPGSYSVVTTFTSNDPNYTDATNTAAVTITDPTIPTGVSLTPTSTSSITVSWNAAWEPDAALTPASSYNIYEKLWHKGIHDPKGSGGTPGYYYYVAIASGITTTSYTITGLAAASYLAGYHTYVVNSVSPSGAVSAQSVAVTGQPLYVPSFAYAITPGGALVGWEKAEVGATAQVKLVFYGNESPTISVISGPATMSIDPATGMISYTPAASEVGNVVATFKATNSTGSATATFSFTVIARPTLVVTGGTFTFDGSVHPATAVAYASDGVTPVPGYYSFTYSPVQYPTAVSTAPYAESGSYIVHATFTSSDPNYGEATGASTITISPATPTITIFGGPFSYDGNPHAATAAALGVDGVSPVNGTFEFTYDGSATVPSLPGTYQVQASFTVSPSPYTTIVDYTNAVATGSLVILLDNPLTVHSGPIHGGLQGPAGITVTGPGTATLTGPNSYAGATVVQGGTLIVTGADALPDGGSLIVGANAGTLFGSTVHSAAKMSLASVVAPPAPASSTPTPTPAVPPMPTLLRPQTLSLSAGETGVMGPQLSIHDLALLTHLAGGAALEYGPVIPSAFVANSDLAILDSLRNRSQEIQLLVQRAAAE
jgi:autotransporter-associated beta strand protein